MIGKKKERTKKQSIIIAIVFFILCGLAGFVAGFSQAIMDREGISLIEIIPRLFHAASHGFMIGIVCIELFLTILLIRYYVVAKRLYQNLDPDDDAGRDKIDEVLSHVKAGPAVFAHSGKRWEYGSVRSGR